MIDPTLAALIRLRLGEQRYGVFFACGEGSFYEDGTEESSGSVVAEDGRHYDYWLGWDDQQQAPTLTVWEPLDRYGNWRESAEYRQACADAGWEGEP